MKCLEFEYFFCFFFIRWYLGSVLWSGKLKIKVVWNYIESNILVIVNGIVIDVFERILDVLKLVNYKLYI